MNLTVRCSSLPILSKCAAAAVPPEPKIGGPNYDACLGTAFHAMMAAHVQGQRPSLTDCAEQHCVEEEDLAPLFHLGLKTWESCKEHFPDPQCERELSADFGNARLLGHPDVLAAHEGVVRVLDYKTGWLSEDHMEQLLGYAALALIHHPDCDNALVATARIRDQVVDYRHFTGEQVNAWLERLADRLAGRTDAYTPGRHCIHCPRGHSCPAKTALLTQAVQFLDEKTWRETPPGSPARHANLLNVLDRVKLVRKALDEAEDMIRAEVGCSPGKVLKGDDGRELHLVTQEHTKISFARGEPVLRQALGEALGECVEVKKTKVESAVRSHAERGEKKAAVEELFKKLEESGALSKEPVYRLEVKQTSPMETP